MFRNNYKSVNISPSSSYFGGATSIYKNISWTTIIYVILTIFFILFGYYMYKSYTSSSESTAYKANRENMPAGSKQNNEAEMILFYVDWCPHCKTAKPEWESLKSEYATKTVNGYNIIFTEYNCTNESPEIEDLMNKYKIEGYPTIKLLKDNQVIEYDAKPTKSTMEQFLNTVL